MTKLSVPDMSCGHCKATIEKAVGAADAAAELNFDMEARTVEVKSALALDQLLAVLKAEGYPASLT